MWILCNTNGKKAGLLEVPTSCSVRVSRYGLKTLLCIFWNSSGVPYDRVSEMSPMATPYAKYHKLTKVANKYSSHYDNTSENCGLLRLEDNALKHTANQRKTTFLHQIVRLVATHRIVRTRLQTICIHFVLYNAS